jgi:hypothetical protein
MPDSEKLTRQNEFLKHLATSRQIREAALKTGVSECTPYEWRKDADFRRKLEDILPPRVPTEILKQRFLKELAKSGVYVDAAREVGVGESTPRLWLRNPDFRKAADEAVTSARNDAQQTFLKHYSQTGRRKDACAQAEIATATYTRWLNDYPEFKQQVAEAKPAKVKKREYLGRRKSGRIPGTVGITPTKYGCRLDWTQDGKHRFERIESRPGETPEQTLQRGAERAREIMKEHPFEARTCTPWSYTVH